MPSKPNLHLIQGSRERAIQIGPSLITPGISTRPPFPVTITVHAEDTWRVLSPPSVLPETSEHPIRTATDLIDQQPLAPGSLLIQGPRWLSVVYDLDRQPICQEAWISQAVAKLLAAAADKGIEALKLPLLGSEHGDLPWQRSLALICRALQAADQGPKRIWLLIPHRHIDESWGLLQEIATRAGAQ